MTRQRTSPLRRLRARQGDDGFALVLVMGFMVVISLIVVTVFAVANRTLSSSASHDRYEQALSAAENGIDQTVARLQTVYTNTGIDEYASPETTAAWDPTPDCAFASITSPVPFASAAAEQSWARSTLLQLSIDHPSCIRQGADGEYIVVKPANTINAVTPSSSVYRQTVYAMGWAPNHSTAGAKTRVVKSEYLFAPYRPTNAVLTGGALEIDSSTLVTTADGVDPTLAAVHSNSSVTVGGGNPTVTGPVSASTTASGSSNNFLGGTIAISPPQGLPVFTAATVYRQRAEAAGSTWHDLCSDGYIHVPPAVGATATPCSGPVLTTTPSTFGWSYTAASGTNPAVWTASKLDDNENGTWYANGANVEIGPGNGAMGVGTIIASSVDTSVCQKVGGTIHWNHIDIGAPSIPNLFMLADADLNTDPNWHAGDKAAGIAGLFVAGDQVNMQTSSAGLVGAVVAVDKCPNADGSGNVVKNPSVYFDPDAEAPFTDIIRTTLWLELTS